MFQHSLRIAIRGFKRFKATFVINLIGLSTGLAIALIILLWISGELSVDKFHENDSRLFQVMTNEHQEGRTITMQGTGGILGEALKNEMPEIEYATAMTPPDWFKKFNILSGNTTLGANGNFVGKDYFHVFSYKLLQGNRSTVLADKNSIVLSKKMAEKLFHTSDNAVGKVLEWRWLTYTRQCTVSGVFEDAPANSSQHFDFVLSMEVWKDISPGTVSFRVGPFDTYLVLKEGTNADGFNQKITEFIKHKDKTSTATLFLRKYSDAYLHGTYENGIQTGGRIEYLELFSLIAIFVLIIACINFMNLSTARASRRMKEISIKKALGVGRYTLVFQFLAESMLLSFISLLIALLLVYLFLPQFSQLAGRQIAVVLNWRLIGAVTGITVVVGIIAGSYPAFYLSGLKFGSGNATGESLIRKGLVTFQFTLSIVFIVAAMVMYNQLNFVQTKKPGYDKDNIIYFEMEGRVADKTDAFLSELKTIPGVVNASSIQQQIILPTFVPGPGVQWDGKNQDDKIRFHKMPVNYDMLETLGIEMKEGRAFSRDFGTDSTAVVLNETAVKIMGLTYPIGKTITLDNMQKRIVGIAKDFHFNSMHEEIKPFIFWLAPKETALIMAKVKGGEEKAVISSIEQFYSKFNPGFTLDYKFMDEAYQQQYAQEKQVAVLSKYFTALIIIISCLGLLGLAAFTVEKKMKEIGIRKVLGATESNILYVLSVDFTKIILLSIVLALPFSYLLTRNWLDGFAYRIALSPLYFMSAAVIALLAAWFTIGIQTVKAARINPLICLKEE